MGITTWRLIRAGRDKLEAEIAKVEAHSDEIIANDERMPVQSRLEARLRRLPNNAGKQMTKHVSKIMVAVS